VSAVSRAAVRSTIDRLRPFQDRLDERWREERQPDQPTDIAVRHSFSLGNVPQRAGMPAGKITVSPGVFLRPPGIRNDRPVCGGLRRCRSGPPSRETGSLRRAVASRRDGGPHRRKATVPAAGITRYELGEYGESVATFDRMLAVGKSETNDRFGSIAAICSALTSLARVRNRFPTGAEIKDFNHPGIGS
jgi:hypothetical protein